VPVSAEREMRGRSKLLPRWAVEEQGEIGGEEQTEGGEKRDREG